MSPPTVLAMRLNAAISHCSLRGISVGMRLACRSRASCSSSRNFTLSMSSIARSTAMARNITASCTNVASGGLVISRKTETRERKKMRKEMTKMMRRCGASFLVMP
jgi:hypothetical protein